MLLAPLLQSKMHTGTLTQQRSQDKDIYYSEIKKENHPFDKHHSNNCGKPESSMEKLSKLVDKGMMRNRYLVQSQNIYPKDTINDKVKSDTTLEEDDRHILTKWIKFMSYNVMHQFHRLDF